MDLRWANLTEADLHGANLSTAGLYETELTRVNLCGANLRETNLIGADLCGADLREATLYKSSLLEANLRGANLKGAKDIELAHCNGGTILPDGTAWHATVDWMLFIEGIWMPQDKDIHGYWQAKGWLRE